MKEKMISILKELSINIGPRRPTSEAEKKAAYFIEKSLSKEIDGVKVLPFSSLSSFSWPFGFIYLLSALGGIIACMNLSLGIILSLLGLITFILEINSFPLITTLLSWRKSQNVVAKIKPLKKKKCLIITAHYDSSRPALLFHPKMVGGFRRSFLMMSGAIFIMPLLLLLSYFQNPFMQFLPLVPSIYLLGSILLLIHRELMYKDTPGANDNASGVAVLLGVGEKLGKKGLQETEVYLVATGSEESGTIGMIHFLKDLKEEVKGAFVINLDNLGTGELKYTTGEGMLKIYPSSKELITFMEEINQEKGYGIKKGVNTLMTTDAIPAMARGFKAISLRAEDEQGLLPNWHWPTDTWEKVEEKNLLLAFEVVCQLVEKVDKYQGDQVSKED